MSIAQNPQKRHLSEFIGSQKPPEYILQTATTLNSASLTLESPHKLPNYWNWWPKLDWRQKMVQSSACAMQYRIIPLRTSSIFRINAQVTRLLSSKKCLSIKRIRPAWFWSTSFQQCRTILHQVSNLTGSKHTRHLYNSRLIYYPGLSYAEIHRTPDWYAIPVCHMQGRGNGNCGTSKPISHCQFSIKKPYLQKCYNIREIKHTYDFLIWSLSKSGFLFNTTCSQFCYLKTESALSYTMTLDYTSHPAELVKGGVCLGF